MGSAISLTRASTVTEILTKFSPLIISLRGFLSSSLSPLIKHLAYKIKISLRLKSADNSTDKSIVCMEIDATLDTSSDSLASYTSTST